jgi:F-type H+-transporting ATPase subunit c
MSKPLARLFLVGLLLMLAGGSAWGQETDHGSPDAVSAPASPAMPAGAIALPNSVAVVGICVGAALAAIGGSFGIARVGAACIEAIARQPEASGAMFAPMVIGAAMIEGGMLFAIVVCLLGILGVV